MGSQGNANPPTGQLFSGTPSATNTGLTFGLGGNTPMGFMSSNIRMPSFSTPAAAATTGLTMPPVTSTSTGLTFGVPKPATLTPGFTLGATSTASLTSALTFGTPATAPISGFNLGTNTSSLAQTTTGISFGTPVAPTTSTNANSTVTTSAPVGFSLATTSSSFSLPTSNFSLNTSTAASTTSSTTSFPTSSTVTTASTGFSLGNAAPTFSTNFSLNKTTAANTISAASTASATQTTLGAVTTVSSSTGNVQTGAINFCQLEESINKWTLELEEQEKVFMNQAAQVNVWDKLLIANGEKIVTLNQEIERVKLEQQQLEHELDYVVGQQKELQDCLVPLEKEFSSLSVSDLEREYTYRLAEKLDTQLKQMSEDLKEIIEHLNEANRTQDSSDPIVQIGKILNAHMNSLQWIDQNSSMIAQKIQQIDQMHQNFRQENERSFNLAYN